VHELLFFIFAALCVGAAVNLLVQRHPINSALSLVVVMLALAMIYLLLGAEFVAAVQVIVYAGAIMVLFVFVIMLLNAGEEERTAGSRVASLFGIPGVFVLGGVIAWMFLGKTAPQEDVGLGSFLPATRDIAKALFTDFLLPFEITTVLILIAIMGAVVIARREEHR
jgi:NADH-quinone oxidoreductase subunit J